MPSGTVEALLDDIPALTDIKFGRNGQNTGMYQVPSALSLPLVCMVIEFANGLVLAAIIHSEAAFNKLPVGRVEALLDDILALTEILLFHACNSNSNSTHRATVAAVGAKVVVIRRRVTVT